jgi:hypothetical protein
VGAHHEILHHVHHGKTRFPQIYLGFSRSARARPGLLPTADQLGSERSPVGVRDTIRTLVRILLITRRMLPSRSIRILTGDILGTA